MRFKDKNVLNTGGASGLGAATALRFATEGAQVIIVGRNVEKGNRVVAQIQAQGGTAFFLEADLADDDSIRQCGELENLETDYCLMGRVGRPEEVAAAILFLASDEASFITATTLHVDGGRVMY